ncbi:MAG: thioesterase family protein, partial [Stellaceae bacterium]
LGAPFDHYRGEVLPEWLDPNGHMNVGFYVVAFDRATDRFCRPLGVAWDYVKHGLGSVFVLEAHATFERELRGGSPIRVTTQLLACDEKRAHLFHSMYHAAEGFLAATNELLLSHVDLASRRSAPWRAETLARLQAIAAAHRALPRPAQAGRVIAIRRST